MPRRFRSQLPLLLALTAILTGCGAAPLAGAPAPLANAAVPNFSHIFIVVMENKSYAEIVESDSTPYFNQLAREYGLATNYRGVTHPSLPNYLALTGGSTFGISRDCNGCFVGEPNIADQLEAAGKTWKAYMESMPEPCFIGDAKPLYYQKHNPFIYYNSIRNDPARCRRIVPLTDLERDLAANTLPNYVWITPNMCSDTHDCSSGDGDTWLKTWVPQILSSPAWRNGGALFITFDEGKRTVGGPSDGGHLATLVISPLGKPGFRSATAYDHYALLRTVERAWGLPELKNAGCECTPTMGEFFFSQTIESEEVAPPRLSMILTPSPPFPRAGEG